MPHRPSRQTASADSAAASRSTVSRSHRIHEILCSGTTCTAYSLAEILGVSVKTIRRDLEYLRVDQGLPIKYSAARRSLYYSEAVDSFPGLQITQTELGALRVSGRALESFTGNCFVEPLHSAYGKLTGGLSKEVKESWNEFGQSIFFKTQGAEAITDRKVHETVSQALRTRVELRLRYRKPESKVYEPRRVHPLQLACVEGIWYLFAYDLARKGTRLFALPRMERLEVTKSRFERSAYTDSLEQKLAHCLGIFGGDKPERIHLRFTGPAARLVMERRWHPTQQFQEEAEDVVTMQMDLAITRELERWVLGWGSQVQVLAPASLKATIRAHAEKILAQ